MKKLITSIASLLLVVLIIFSFTSCHTVRVADEEIVAVFQYADINVSTKLSHEDAELVRDMFNGKIAFSDSPSCGFGKDVALTSDGYTYCIATDTCGIIYVLEKDKYFHLSNEEIETLHHLLSEYGFKFPCI